MHDTCWNKNLLIFKENKLNEKYFLYKIKYKYWLFKIFMFDSKDNFNLTLKNFEFYSIFCFYEEIFWKSKRIYY